MSITYHIWHNGQDHGPYTHAEMAGMLSRGEMVGIQWRRSGDTQYRGHTELAAELEPTPEKTLEMSLPRRAEPKGDSFWGELGTALGALAICIGIAIVFFEPSVGGALIGAGLGLVSFSTLLRIHAKLALIAHRLQR